MLKHILTGQPSSTAGSRLHQHNDFLPHSASTTGHLHQHNGAGAALRQSRSPAGRAQSSADVYDNVHPQMVLGQRAAPQFHRHGLNHSQLSVNNLAQRLNASLQHPVGTHGALNLSQLSTSKHSVNSVSPVVGANLVGNGARTHALIAQLQQQHHHQQHQQHLQHAQQHSLHERSKINGGLDISRMSRLPSHATPSPAPGLQGQTGPATATTSAATTTSTGPSIVPLNVSWSSSSLSRNQQQQQQQQNQQKGLEAGVKEMLTSLGLLCLVSLLLALLSLTFLIRMSSVSFMPNSLISPEEFAIVYDVTLVLCALALSLNLCCLLVCAIQFLFAVKLVKSSYHGHRTNKYLQKSSISRVCAVGGFFISIPVFLTGMILYTFIQFQSTPAIVTSVFIGLGIIFCGCALVHTVFVWQKEKTNAMKALRREQYEAAAQLQRQQNLHSQQQQQQQQQQHHQQHHHQQQQQQHQSHPQQQLRSMPISYGAASRLAAATGNDHLTSGSSGVLTGRGPVATSQQLHQPLHHTLHSHRHVSMSPPLLISSPADRSLHSQLNASQRSQVLRPTSPPVTPGDRSPATSPANKHNRSQQLVSRDATGSVSPGLPAATLDLSSAANTNSPHELSTLV